MRKKADSESEGLPEKRNPNRTRSRIIGVPVNAKEGSWIDKEYERKIPGFQARLRRQWMAPITSRNLAVDRKKAVYLARLGSRLSAVEKIISAQYSGNNCDLVVVNLLLAAILEEAKNNAL
jgi:hypothetical protein